MRRVVLLGVGLGLGLVALVSPPLSRARACGPGRPGLTAPPDVRTSTTVFPEPPRVDRAYEHTVSVEDSSGCGETEYGCGYRGVIFEVQTSTSTLLEITADGLTVVVPRDADRAYFYASTTTEELRVSAPFEAQLRFLDLEGNASLPVTVQVTERRYQPI